MNSNNAVTVLAVVVIKCPLHCQDGHGQDRSSVTAESVMFVSLVSCLLSHAVITGNRGDTQEMDWDVSSSPPHTQNLAYPTPHLILYLS